MTLKFVIEAVLKGQGITATVEQLEQLEAKLTESAKAGEPLKVTADSITEAFREQSKEQQKTNDETERQREEMKEAAFWTLYYQTGTDKASASTKSLGSQMGDLSRAAGNTKQVMDGLSQGSIGGLITSGRGLLGLLRSITLAGAAFAGVLAGAGAGLLAFLSIRSNRNLDEMARAFDAAAKSAENYRERLAVVQAEVSQLIKQQLADVQSLNSEYDFLLGRIDAAAKRNQALTAARRAAEDASIDAEEQGALAQARPDARDGVRRTFARRRGDLRLQREAEDITTSELSAFVREKAANEALQAARAQIDALEAQIREAQAKADDALARTQQFAPTDSSPAALAARKEARAQQEGVKTLREQSQREIAAADKAQREQEAAQQIREEAAFRRRALGSRRDAETTARSIEDRDLDIAARQKQRDFDLQSRANSAGAGLEDIVQTVIKSPSGNDPALRALVNKVLEAAQKIQGEATGDELAEAVAAITAFAQATQGMQSRTREEIIALGRQLRDLEGQVKALRL